MVAVHSQLQLPRTLWQKLREEIELGKKPEQATPFWRLMEPDSTIAQKLACGSDFINEMRQQEGINQGIRAIADTVVPLYLGSKAS